MHMFEEIIESRCYLIDKDVSDWKEAIKLASKSLLDKGYVTEQFIIEIIKSTESLGPYYVLSPNFAMPHTKPEHGVLKSGFSLLTSTQGVKFGSETNDPVNIILCVVATSKEIMAERMIGQVLDFLNDRELFDEIKNCKTDQEFLDVIRTR